MAAGGESLTEDALRRSSSIVVVALAALTLLSWAYIVTGAGMGMSAWDMTTVSLFPHRVADMSMGGAATHAWTPGYWIITLLMWWVMMIGMMTPSAAPTILLYGRAARHAQAADRPRREAVPTAAFAGGYLLSWLGFSILATVAMWALEGAHVIAAATMASSTGWFSGAVLTAAGLYQLSPLKHQCLRRCRSPAEFLSRRWKPGPTGALRMGLEHGLFCIGCCWVLMALLFVGGIMNLLWIGILALIVLLEKVAPHGHRLASLGGVTLLVWGGATLVV